MDSVNLSVIFQDTEVNQQVAFEHFLQAMLASEETEGLLCLLIEEACRANAIEDPEAIRQIVSTKILHAQIERDIRNLQTHFDDAESIFG